jgi:uncharacterized protein Yka (UPF0111/DUF47 family)
MALAVRPDEPHLLDLLDEGGRNAQRAAVLLREMLAGYPEHAHLAHDLVVCEQEGDRITHDLIHGLQHRRARRRVPFGSADGHRLATALDDVVDLAEQTGDTLGVYRVEAPMEPAVGLADVLVGATAEVAQALGALRTGAPLGPRVTAIKRLESDADRLSRAAVGTLFASGIDPMVVIRWKDIYASLEAAVDACEQVAHVLEGIGLRRRRRPWR